MYSTSCTASLNFLSNRFNLILKEIHEFIHHDGGAYTLSLFFSQTPHRVEEKLGIVSIQVDDTGKVNVPGSSSATL